MGIISANIIFLIKGCVNDVNLAMRPKAFPKVFFLQMFIFGRGCFIVTKP